MPGEGVIKFRADHRREPLDSTRYGGTCCRLLAWREILVLTGLVGQEPGRYEGYGYGNVSTRVGPPSRPRGRRTFLVSGTQTSGLPHPTLADFCIVTGWSVTRNEVESRGSTLPSSESLTHASVYDLGTQIRWVFHVHSPVIWKAAATLGIPTTAAGVEYGTTAMAREVQRLWSETGLSERRLFAMAGHEDGIVAFGRTASEAGTVILDHLASAYEQYCLRPRLPGNDTTL